MRRLLRLVLVASIAVIFSSLAYSAAAAWPILGAGGGRPPGGSTLRLVAVAAGFQRPVQVVQPSSDPSRLYVVEQGGRIRVPGFRGATTFLDIASLVSCCGEQGLLSAAFSPGYATNRLFYVDYTDRAGNTVVAEFRAGPLPSTRERTLLTVTQPYANHNGGQLAFGPDGYLYAGLGDGGSAGDPGNNAQNLSSYLGKILRLDTSNPAAAWEIVGYGFRNPWRFTFDRLTGDLWVGDVGQGAWEEIDYTPAGSPGLENYGWRPYEGNAVYSGETPDATGALVFPIYAYSHAQGCSVTGGYRYRGSIPSLAGRYVFGDFCTGKLSSFLPVGALQLTSSRST